MEPLSLEALSKTLPDAVKLRILGLHAAQASSSSAPRTAPTASSAAAAGPLPSTCSTAGVVVPPASSSVTIPKVAGGMAVLDGVLSVEQIQAAVAEAETLLEQRGQAARMGSNMSADGKWLSSALRGDTTCWLHKEDLQEQGCTQLSALLSLLEGVRQQLLLQGHDVAGGVSYQLACYPGSGARYVRHSDASDASPGRSMTALLYLNHAWEPQVHGGQLALYNFQSSGPVCGKGWLAGEAATIVAPLGGRLVLFDSRIQHEVLPSQRHRYAITAWYYKLRFRDSKIEHNSRMSVQHEVPNGVMDPAPLSSHLDACSTRDAAGHCTVTSSTTATSAAETEAGLHASTAPSCNRQEAAAPAGTSYLSSSAANCTTAEGAVGQQLASLVPSVKQQLSPPASQPAPSSTPALPAAAGTSPSTSATSTASTAPAQALPRIFVSIASFRDPECQWTLHSLFSRATHPQRVSVGVVWQVDAHEDAPFVRVAGVARGGPAAEGRARVREVRLDWREAQGPCYARFLAQQLWQGEEYVLQVDAHMRFVPGWDELCIQQLTQAELQCPPGSCGAVLSTYPVGYDGEGPQADVPHGAPPTLLCAQGFAQEGLLRFEARALRTTAEPEPLPSSFWAAGFSFSRSALLQHVPYCPHLPHLFFGEEQYMLARMWTHGWDVYAPSCTIAAHQWTRSARKSSYQAADLIIASQRAASQARVRGMLLGEAATTSTVAVSADSRKQHAGETARVDAVANMVFAASTSSKSGHACAVDDGCIQHSAVTASGSYSAALAPPEEADWAPGGKWGLGMHRTLAQFEARCGVSFALKQVSPAAGCGGLHPDVFAGGVEGEQK